MVIFLITGRWLVPWLKTDATTKLPRLKTWSQHSTCNLIRKVDSIAEPSRQTIAQSRLLAVIVIR